MYKTMPKVTHKQVRRARRALREAEMMYRVSEISRLQQRVNTLETAWRRRGRGGAALLANRTVENQKETDGGEQDKGDQEELVGQPTDVV